MRTRRLSLILTAGLMFALALQAAPASAWSGTVNFGPTVVYQGDYQTFYVTLLNTGNSTLFVNWIFVHFCWNASGHGMYFKDDDGSSLAISSQATLSFTTAATVSQNASGDCVVNIGVNGETFGDPAASTLNYSPVIEVAQRMVVDGVVWLGGIAIIVAVIIVVVVIVVVVVAVVLSSQQKNRGPPKWPMQPPYIRY